MQYADLKEANDRYEEQLLQTPEAYTLSFGKHKNKRLDEVPEDYIWSVIRPSFSDNPWVSRSSCHVHVHIYRCCSTKAWWKHIVVTWTRYTKTNHQAQLTSGLGSSVGGTHSA